MGTEVLRPQDFFNDRFRLSPPAFHLRKTYAVKGNGFGNQRPNNNSGHRKPVLPRPERSDHKKKIQQDQQLQIHLPRRSSSASPPPQPLQKSEHQQHLQQLLFPRRSSSASELQNKPTGVTILRRGQSLDTIDASRMKREINNKARGSLVKKYMDEDDVYAGSAFFVSPSPSSLPLPSFFNNNNNNNNSMSMDNNNNNNSMSMDNNNITINNKDHFHDSASRDLRRLLHLE